MRWCCPAFEGHYGNAGERGFTILIGRDIEDQPQFLLQYRAVDKGMEGLVFSETLLSLFADVQIQFCPWCGCKLNKWYGRYVDQLHRPGLKVTIPGLDDTEQTF